MMPRDVAFVDQVRAALKSALGTKCDCGHCPTEEQIRHALGLDDEALLRVMSDR